MKMKHFKQLYNYKSYFMRETENFTHQLLKIDP